MKKSLSLFLVLLLLVTVLPVTVSAGSIDAVTAFLVKKKLRK